MPALPSGTVTFLFTDVEGSTRLLDGYELVEAYPDDNYLPSYLFLARHGSEAFHVLFVADVEGDNVRIVTSYRPDPREWQADFKTRRPKR
jgi:hypothetical protein